MKNIRNNIFFLISFIFLSLPIINSTENKKLNKILPDLKIIFTVYDYGINRTSYQLTQLNKADLYTDKSCRLSYLTSKNLSLIEKYSKYYNKKWIFFTENPEIITFLIEENEKNQKQLNKQPYSIYGIIFPNNISNPIDNKKSKLIPLYHIDKQYINDFISFDILNQTTNTYFIISEISIIYEYPIKYLKITSTLTLLISIFILYYLKYKLRTIRNVFLLQKYLIFLPYINLLLAIIIEFECYNMTEQNPNEDNNNSIYLETALFTVNAVFRSVLWILFVLVSAGWLITKSTFPTNEIKTFIKIFVFIYLMMCIDQIIDSFNTPKTIFKASEIKNFIFYILMLIYVTYKGMKTINFLKKKLNYSAMFNTIQYIPALKIKITMMKSHTLNAFIFLFLYIFTILIHKFFFIVYDTQKFETIQYHYLDLIFMSVFLFIFNPSDVPDFFDIDYGDDLNEIGNIYKCNVPEIEKLKNANYTNHHFKNKEAKTFINENIPVVIINPFFGENINGNNIDTIIYNSNIGFLKEN